MSLDEIREAFISGAAVIQKAVSWRNDRVAELSSTRPIQRYPIWAAVHICPLVAFSSLTPRFDPQSQHQSGEYQLRTPADYGSGRPNYLGWLVETRDREDKLFESVQVFRDFRMEVLLGAGDERPSGLVFWSGVFESSLGEWLARFQKWAAHFEFPFPALVFISLMGTEDTLIVDDYNRYQTSEPVLLLEPSFIEDIKFEPRSVLKPSYDHLYQSYGFASSPYFDEQGNWRPRRR
ncbi:MAG: hypothetical protein R3C16_03960 [Hyphomonadaceae bacterium]